MKNLLLLIVTMLGFSLWAGDVPVSADVLKGRNIRDYYFGTWIYKGGSYVVDEDAKGGKAQRIASESSHKNSMLFGMYDTKAKKVLARVVLPPKKVPFDEKYHLYHLGTMALTSSCVFYLHQSWRIQRQEPGAVAGKFAPGTLVDVYASIKMTGPDYVPGSTEQSAVYLDRLIFAENKK